MPECFEVNVVFLCFLSHFRGSLLQFNIHNVYSFLVALGIEKYREI